MNLKYFKFTYGKSYSDSNVYTFTDGKYKLIISEKVGKFTIGETSNYLLFEVYRGDECLSKEYVNKNSEEYKELKNIRPIVENIGGVVVQCASCKSIVLKEQLTSMKGDKCIYCDKYACKKCKKFFPKVELDENRLCIRCRGKE